MFNFKRKNILNSNSGEVFMGVAYATMQVVAVGIITLGMLLSAGASKQTIKQASYASFVQKMGQFSDSVKIQAAVVLAETGKNGKVINNAQRFHMAANGLFDLEEGDGNGVYEMNLPVGYEIPASIYNALGLSEKEEVVAYRITDLAIDGYQYEEDTNFYGDDNGTEYHLVTSNGMIFTIPGFKEEREDGSARYYITSQGHYYTVIGDSNLSESSIESIEKNPIVASDFKKLYGVTKDAKEVNKSPIYKANLIKTNDKNFKVKMILKKEKTDNKEEVDLFLKNIDEYTQYILDAKLDKMMEAVSKKVYPVNAQYYYAIANGADIPAEKNPMGVKLNYDFLKKDEICYEVKKDSYIYKYYSEKENLCGSENDNEKHYITSTGRFIVLPGFKVERENGEVVYYVNDTDYYTK